MPEIEAYYTLHTHICALRMKTTHQRAKSPQMISGPCSHLLYFMVHLADSKQKVQSYSLRKEQRKTACNGTMGDYEFPLNRLVL